MNLTRLIAVAILALALCGCTELKNDRILGDHPWQPSNFGMKND